MQIDDISKLPIRVAAVVRAYLSNNQVSRPDLVELIDCVARSLRQLDSPPIPVEDTIHPDRLMCFECGRLMRQLTTHLNLAHGMTPLAYRARWKLPATYPMISANYSEERRKIATDAKLGRIGLSGRGRKRTSAAGRPPYPA